MISVKVVEVNPSRLTKLRRELRKVSNQDFFRTIPLAEYERKILEFLRSESPEGHNDYRDFLAFLGYPTKRGPMMSFKSGWRTARETVKSSVSIRIWNLLETIGGKEGQKKFRAIEYGTSTSTWVAKRTFRFVGDDGWKTIKQGTSVTHVGNKGADVQQKTKDYIVKTLLPQISDTVYTNIARRLK